jgi:polar amino acid transport system substrate-binding protein
MKRIILLVLTLTVGVLTSALIYAETKKTLIVGFGMNKPPYVFENENSGLEVEIFREAARAAGYEIKPFFGPLERLKSKMQSGELDAIAVTNVNENLHYYSSLPFVTYHNYAIALKKKNLKIKTIADLKNYSITSFQRSRNLLGSDFEKMTKENPQYREFADQKLRNVQLYKERVDVAIADKRIFEYFNTQLNSTININQPIIMYDLFKKNQYQAAFHSEAVMKNFNKGLLEIKQNGVYEKIEIKYSRNKNGQIIQQKK